MCVSKLIPLVFLFPVYKPWFMSILCSGFLCEGKDRSGMITGRCKGKLSHCCQLSTQPVPCLMPGLICANPYLLYWVGINPTV